MRRRLRHPKEAPQLQEYRAAPESSIQVLLCIFRDCSKAPMPCQPERPQNEGLFAPRRETSSDNEQLRRSGERAASSLALYVQPELESSPGFHVSAPRNCTGIRSYGASPALGLLLPDSDQVARAEKPPQLPGAGLHEGGLHAGERRLLHPDVSAPNEDRDRLAQVRLVPDQQDRIAR